MFDHRGATSLNWMIFQQRFVTDRWCRFTKHFYVSLESVWTNSAFCSLLCRTCWHNKHHPLIPIHFCHLILWIKRQPVFHSHTLTFYFYKKSRGWGICLTITNHKKQTHTTSTNISPHICTIPSEMHVSLGVWCTQNRDSCQSSTIYRCSTVLSNMRSPILSNFFQLI